MTTRPPSTSTSGTIASTNGTSASPPPARRDDEQVLGGAGSRRPRDLADPVPVGGRRRAGRRARPRTRPPRRRRARRAATSASRRVPRSDSAPVRSGISSKPSSQTPWWTRVAAHGQRAGARRTRPSPRSRRRHRSANRRSGSSVCSWTVTSPRRPCGLPMRATRSWSSRQACARSSQGGWLGHDATRAAGSIPAALVDDAAVSGPGRCRRCRPGRLATGQRAHHGAQGARGAAGAADHAAEVVGVDPDLEHLTAAELLASHGDVVLVVDDALDEVLERLFQHGQAWSASVGLGGRGGLRRWRREPRRQRPRQPEQPRQRRGLGGRSSLGSRASSAFLAARFFGRGGAVGARVGLARGGDGSLVELLLGGLGRP